MCEAENHRSHDYGNMSVPEHTGKVALYQSPENQLLTHCRNDRDHEQVDQECPDIFGLYQRHHQRLRIILQPSQVLLYPVKRKFKSHIEFG